jgi:hypothetical protein
MPKTILYNYAPTAPTQITRENYNAVGGGDNIVGNIRRAFKSDTDFEIWDAAVLGTQLVDGVDYELRDLDNVLTNDAGYDVYSAYKILNVAYQACNLYITYKIVMSYNDAATANTIIPNTILTEQGDIIYASAPSTPAALHHGAAAGYLLQSGGHAANPSWVAPPITLLDADITINSTLAKNTRNFINATTRLTLTLPAAMAKSDIIEIIDIGGYGYKIKPGASQTLKYFNIVTVTGEVTNSFVQSKTGYSSVKLVCETANTKWQATEIRDVYAGKGYAMGGNTGAVSALIDDMNFATEASSQIVANLDTARQGCAGVSGNSKGFCMGGWTGAASALIDDMNFATETSSQIVANLDTAREGCAGVSGNSKGFCMGGNTGAASALIDDMNFATETSSQIVASLNTARYYPCGVSSNVKGYAMGGNTGAASALIDDMNFATETSSQIVASLDTAREGCAGVSGNSKGFCMGGLALAASTLIDDMNFATETSSQIVASLDTAREWFPGVSGIVNGYVMGGFTGATSKLIDDMNFNTETSSLIAASLDTARYSACGVSGCI